MSQHYVDLAWQAPTTGTPPTSYKVFRGTAAGQENATPIASGVTGTTYRDEDPGLVEGQDYFYYVKAEANNLDSVPSNEANAVIPFVAPNAPTNLTATAS